jgi:DNA mismatch repair protein MutL
MQQAMTRIKELSTDIIIKIAAGEVVERPVSIVKELIDNAIDAKATQIDIELLEGGNRSIRVIDNGEGIAKNELGLAIKPHTTSKIETIEDLQKISSLGFRGEALASIDHVASIIVESRKANSSLGWKIEQNKISSVGMQEGTRVTVQNLFDKVPARKKFLKSAQSELKIMIDTISDYLLSHPHIGFSLVNDKRQLLSISRGSVSDRLVHVFGKEASQQLLEVKRSDSYVQLVGFLTKPQIAASSNTIRLFVNGRKVVDTLMSTAIRDAYSNLLFPRSYPIGVLFVTVPPELVDVNVHPTKREVRFINPKEIYEQITNAVLHTLTDNNLTFHNVSFRSDFSKALINELQQDHIAHIGEVVTNTTITQFHNVYLAVETMEGVMFIDQHAAHESILYYKLLDIFEKKEKNIKPIPLSEPYLFEATSAQSIIVESHLEKLATLGFEIELFGKNTFRIVSVPESIADRDITTILPLLEHFIESGTLLDEKNKRVLATLACKAAIKANQALSVDQRTDLVHALTSRNYAYTCPHGRPVKIEITLNELDRLFKRK